MGTAAPTARQGGDTEATKKRKLWPGIVGLVVVIGVIPQCSGGPGKDEAPSSSSKASSSSSPDTEKAAAPAEPVKAPLAIPAPMNFIAEKYGIKVNAVDVGQHIVDGVDRERAIFDPANWRIVAQCDYMTDNTLNAGVIKSDEWAIISQAGQGTSISENFFKFLLDCPADETAPDERETTAPAPAAAAAPESSSAPSTRPAPTDAQVKDAFQAYIDERADSGVMLAESVTSVTVAAGVVTVTMDPSPALLELSPYDNLAELFGTPVVFNDDESAWLRESVQRVDVVDSNGQSLGSMTAAELNKKSTG